MDFEYFKNEESLVIFLFQLRFMQSFIYTTHVFQTKSKGRFLGKSENDWKKCIGSNCKVKSKSEN